MIRPETADLKNKTETENNKPSNVDIVTWMWVNVPGLVDHYFESVESSVDVEDVVVLEHLKTLIQDFRCNEALAYIKLMTKDHDLPVAMVQLYTVCFVLDGNIYVGVARDSFE